MKNIRKLLFLVFIIVTIILIISTLILVLSKKRKSKTENNNTDNIVIDIANSINKKIKTDIVDNIESAVKADVNDNKVEEKDDIENLKVINIDDKKIILENGYIIYLNNKKIKFTNARTKKKYSISDIKVKDYIQLYKMKYIEKDKNLLILDSEKVEVIRNLKGKKLLDEILYSYTLDIQFLNGEMKDLKKLKNGEYLVTFIIKDYYTDITKNKEKFKKTFKIRKDTLLGSIYKTRYENIIHAKDNMIDMVLDKNTLKQKYPECKRFTFYDG